MGLETRSQGGLPRPDGHIGVAGKTCIAIGFNSVSISLPLERENQGDRNNSHFVRIFSVGESNGLNQSGRAEN